jgi:hypothetical protein
MAANNELLVVENLLEKGADVKAKTNVHDCRRRSPA